MGNMVSGKARESDEGKRRCDDGLQGLWSDQRDNPWYFDYIVLCLALSVRVRPVLLFQCRVTVDIRSRL